MYYDCYYRWFSRLNASLPYFQLNLPILMFASVHTESISFCSFVYFNSLQLINVKFKTLVRFLIQSNSIIYFQIIKMFSLVLRQLLFILLCFYVIHFILLIDYHKIMAEDKKEENLTSSTPPALPECHSPIDLTVDGTWLEKVVFGNFRVWHIMFSGIAIGIAITVVLCCLFRCRIPRTKQEIEADFLRKKITESFRSHLEKIKLDELQGNYDRHDLLPVFKKVELFEEDRLQKNEGFGRRKLTWKQKLKRLFSSGKDSTDEFGDKSIDESRDQSGTEYKKMTKEEMETVEKEVEGAKTDSSALNMINDQIAIFSFIGESKKDRKKRIKELKKAEKALKKEQKMKEKLDKKLAKQEAKEKIKSGAASSARAKSTQKLMELRGDTLDSDHQWSELAKFRQQHNIKENGGESIIIDIEDSDEVKDSTRPIDTFEDQPEEVDDKGYKEISLPIPDKEDFPTAKKSLASRFSFRDTVQKFMVRSFGGKPKETPPRKEELVINIELVKKSDSLEDGLSQLFPQPKVSIPQIECSPPPEREELIEDHSDQQKKKKVKLSKNNSLLTKDESLDRNLLHIPSISKSTKEINSERYEKVKPTSKEKEGKKKRKDKDKDKDKEKKIAMEMNEQAVEEDKRHIKAHKEKKKDVEKIRLEHEKSQKEKGKEKESKAAKGDKHAKDDAKIESSKRTQLKRQTVAENISDKSSVSTVEVDKKEAKKKGKEKEQSKSKKISELSTSKEAKVEAQVEPKLKKHKVDKSKPIIDHKHDKEQIDLEKERKKEKIKVKHLEFDEKTTQKTKSHKRDKEEKGMEGDGKLDTFTTVVEKAKEKHRKDKQKKVEIDIPNGEHISTESLSKHSKEHRTKSKERSEHDSTLEIYKDHQRDKSHQVELLKVSKVPKHEDHHKSSKPIVISKEKDFNRMLTDVHHELKQRFEVDKRAKLLRSKTMDEDRADIISTDEDEQLLGRSKEQFKKRLSEVMLQRTLMISSQPFDGSPGKTMARAKQIRMVKQATSSSEIEIPVEHVYTRGLMACVDVHHPPDSTTLPPSPVALLRHPSVTPMTISIPPSPCSSRSSTISVVTDNIRKKLVEASPETGENRELTYECSRDVIFDVQQQQLPCTSSSKVDSPKSKVSKSVQLQRASSPSPETSAHQHSSSKAHRKKDKTSKETPKHQKGHHH